MIVDLRRTLREKDISIVKIWLAKGCNMNGDILVVEMKGEKTSPEISSFRGKQVVYVKCLQQRKCSTRKKRCFCVEKLFTGRH